MIDLIEHEMPLTDTTVPEFRFSPEGFAAATQPEFFVRFHDQHIEYLKSFAEYLTDFHYIWSTAPEDEEIEIIDRMFNDWLSSEAHSDARIRSGECFTYACCICD